jgi:hypothetical protein
MMVDLLLRLIALKGTFAENVPSLIDAYYYPFDDKTQRPAITFSTALAAPLT